MAAITLNGQHREIRGQLTIEALLAELGVAKTGTAVEINRRLVRKDEYAGTCLSEGDHVEVVTFVGGG